MRCWDRIGKVLFFYFLFAHVNDVTIGKTFELQTVSDRKKIEFLFPGIQIQSIQRIQCVKLEKEIRPPIWKEKDHIPFVLFIDGLQNQAYYLYYYSIYKKDITPLVYPGSNSPSDICATSEGDIFVVDPTANLIAHFKLTPEKNILLEKNLISLKTPFRCETDGKDGLYVLSQENKMYIFKKDSSRLLKRDAELEMKINTAIGSEGVVDLTVTREKRLCLLTTHRVIVFLEDGQLLYSYTHTQPYTAIENTFHGDILLLNAREKKITLFSRELYLLDVLDLSPWFQNLPVDITVYEPYGYLAAASPDFGAYFGLGTSLTSYWLELTGHVRSSYFHIHFTLTFPSEVTVVIEDSQYKIKEILIQKHTLMAGPVTLFWDSSLSTKENLFIRISAKALYSLANVDITRIPVSLKN